MAKKRNDCEGPLVLSEARADIAVRAAGQIESLLLAIIDSARRLDDAGELFPLRVLATRALDLSRVAVSSIGDQVATVTDLRKRLIEPVGRAEASHG
jgi:hypothetical protein